MFHLAQREFKVSEESVNSLEISESKIQKELYSSCEQDLLTSNMQNQTASMRSGKIATYRSLDSGLKESEASPGDSDDLASRLRPNAYMVEHWVFTNIFKIDLSHNFLTASSMYFLGIILGNCTNIVTLDLSFNHLGEQGGIVLFKNLIQLKRSNLWVGGTNPQLQAQESDSGRMQTDDERAHEL